RLQRRAIALDERRVIREIRRAGRPAAGRQRRAVVVRHHGHVQRDFEGATLLRAFQRSGQFPGCQPDRRGHLARAKPAAIARNEVVAQPAVGAVGPELEVHDAGIAVPDPFFDCPPAIVVVGQSRAVDRGVGDRDDQGVVGPQGGLALEGDRTPDFRGDRLALEHAAPAVGRIHGRRDRGSAGNERRHTYVYDKSHENRHSGRLGGRSITGNYSRSGAGSTAGPLRQTARGAGPWPCRHGVVSSSQGIDRDMNVMYKLGLFLLAMLPGLSLAQGQPLVFGINEGVTYRIAASEVRERFREVAEDLGKLLKRPVRIEYMDEYVQMGKDLDAARYDLAYVHPAHYAIRAIDKAHYRLVAVTKGFTEYRASFLV